MSKKELKEELLFNNIGEIYKIGNTKNANYFKYLFLTDNDYLILSSSKEYLEEYTGNKN